jgi:hypothetical protein
MVANCFSPAGSIRPSRCPNSREPNTATMTTAAKAEIGVA